MVHWDQLLSEIRRLYEAVTGESYDRRRLRGQPLDIPGGAVPEEYILRKVAHLRFLLGERMRPLWADPARLVPPVDAFETSRSFVLLIDLPGLTPSDLRLSVGENLVVVKGKRSLGMAEDSRTVLARERCTGIFERWIPLPCRVKHEVAATFRDGVLEIQLEKTESPHRETPAIGFDPPGGTDGYGREEQRIDYVQRDGDRGNPGHSR